LSLDKTSTETTALRHPRAKHSSSPIAVNWLEFAASLLSAPSTSGACDNISASAIILETARLSNPSAGDSLDALPDHLRHWGKGLPALMLTDTALLRNPNHHRHRGNAELPDDGHDHGETANTASEASNSANSLPTVPPRIPRNYCEIECPRFHAIISALDIVWMSIASPLSSDDVR